MAVSSWPETDDDLLLASALNEVMEQRDCAGANEDEYVREAASALLLEAYEQGIRDRAVLVHYALKTLSRGRAG